LAVVVGCAALWAMGLKLFLDSGLPYRRKAGWTILLVCAGAVIGCLLQLDALWRRFLVLLWLLPLLGLLDVFLLRSRRDAWFWIRACGFEVCTVFGTAAAARYLLDRVGVGPLLTQVP